jgi:hypothetical protein
MKTLEPLSTLYQRLQGDRWRLANPFSLEIQEANALLHNPAAYDDEIYECLWKWCQSHQPCQFGAIAAKERRIHFCVLRESALVDWTDTQIGEAIAESKQLWKQRAAYEPHNAAHSFMLVIAAPRVAIAAPDIHLRAFASRVLQLSGWGQRSSIGRHKNAISSDFLYLRNPNDGEFYGFQFNVDLFACSGDRRWWHDHRFPGGIAFTANSTGHMRSYREWYGIAKGDTKEWTVKQAMLTIARAAATSKSHDSEKMPGKSASDTTGDGRLTWLMPLDSSGQPFLRDVTCPLSSVPKQLQGKDWTRYEGFIHTDHAVREEFFQSREFPSTHSSPHLLDFTYLYDENNPEFVDLTRGKHVSEKQILAEIGDRATWAHRHVTSLRTRSEAEESLVAEQLAVCDRWLLDS